MHQPLFQLDLLDPSDPSLAEVAELEWLETDGLGGFACSTVTMQAGRRFHGLLTAPLPGTADRHLFLAGFGETVHCQGETITLSQPRTDADGGAPAFAASATAFELIPWPVTRFQLGGSTAATVTRELIMPKGRHAVLLRYTAGAEDLVLHLQPLLACRPFDALTFSNEALCEEVAVDPGGLRMQPYPSLPPLDLCLEVEVDGVPVADAWQFEPDPDWVRGVEYHMDLRRGYGGHEDLFRPGTLHIQVPAGGSVTLAASVERRFANPAAGFAATAQARLAVTPEPVDLAARCAIAAADFLYLGPGDRWGILAGFPWFGEWGRDTFIALPGLTLARGQLGDCADVLDGALAYLQDGLLPNIFGADRASSHYGSVDAALWFARAVLLYQRAGGDQERIQARFRPALQQIAECYSAGTAPAIVAMGIGGDDGGLIQAGTPELNPTWMDAKPPSGPVTPRYGCPVEIAALWYSLLAQLAELAADRGDATEQQRWDTARERAGASFMARFWRQDAQCLADVWRPDVVDYSIRPNMVMAAAMEFSPLTRAQRASICRRVERDLLTPCGLRTLAAGHPDYQARYQGGPAERDGAYHQGTVWPWPIGFLVEAGLRADPGQRDALRAQLEALAPELDHGGLNHLSEVFDADPPHCRGGTFAQAWNTAEVLRALALLDGRLSLGRAAGECGAVS